MNLHKTFSSYAFAAISLLTVASCTKDNLKNCDRQIETQCMEDAAKANVRITNAGTKDYCNIKVAAGGKRVNYGSLKRGQSTCYIAFDEIYDYAYIELSINGAKYVLQPIDYVGETPLEAGYFTYSITHHEESKQIGLATKKE